MSIPNYRRPQQTIRQQVAKLGTATASRRLALVVGPQYRLSRYSASNATASYAFDTAGGTLPWQYIDSVNGQTNIPSTEVVDLTTTRLYAKNLELTLNTISASNTATVGAFVESLTESNVIRYAQTTGTSGKYFKGSGLATEFYGREVQIGDLVYVTSGFGTKRRKVVGFRGKSTASSVAAAANSAYNPITLDTATHTVISVPAHDSYATSDVTLSGTWDGKLVGGRNGVNYGELYTLVVQNGGAPAVATVNIISKSGLFAASNIVLADNGSGKYTTANAALGGLTIVINHVADLNPGDVFKFSTVEKYERVGESGGGTITTGGTFTGAKNTTYVVEVIAGSTGNVATGATLRISDTAGLETPYTTTAITDAVAFALGTYGVTLLFDLASTAPDQGGLRKGDVYTVAATAAAESTTDINRIVLDGPAVDTGLFTDASVGVAVEFRIPFTGEVLSTAASGGTAWTADTSGLTLNSSLQVLVTARSANHQWINAVDAVGTLYTSFRALQPPAYGEGLITITTASDIVDNCGVVALENELAFGLGEALRGAAGRQVFGLRVAADTLEAFSAALAKVEANDTVYSLVLLTTNEETLVFGLTHCLAMSDPEVKNFRRTYVGVDSPGEYPVLALQPDSSPYTVTITAHGGENTLVTFSQTTALDNLNLDAGDLLKLPVSGDEYQILSVINSYELLLKSGPVNPVGSPVAAQVWKADTVDSQTLYLAQRAQGLYSRRAAIVWQEGGVRSINGVPTTIPNRFLACEIAGLRSALLPQQGLTRTEVTGITSATAMYNRYTPSKLDVIAAAGIFIVTQDVEAGTVYIRHQLDTDTGDGSLYYEDNVAVNLDDISFQYKDVLERYIGKFNATAQVVTRIKNDLTEVLANASQAPSDAGDIGPAVVAFNIPNVYIDPVLRDRIVTASAFVLPSPLNDIDSTLDVVADLIC